MEPVVVTMPYLCSVTSEVECLQDGQVKFLWKTMCVHTVYPPKLSGIHTRKVGTGMWQYL